MTEQGVPTQILHRRCIFFNNEGGDGQSGVSLAITFKKMSRHVDLYHCGKRTENLVPLEYCHDELTEKKKWICRSVESADWCEGRPDMAPWTFSTRMGPRVNRQKIYLSLGGIWDIFISRRNLTSWSSRLERLRLFSGIPAGSGNFNGDVARIPDLSGSANIQEQDISSVLRISGKYL